MHAVQKNKNLIDDNLQDFDAVSKLPMGTYAKNFCGSAKMFRRHNYSKGPEACPTENLSKITLQIYPISVFSETTFKVIFVCILLVFATATPKILDCLRFCTYN